MGISTVNNPCLIIGCGSHCYSVISIIESSEEYKIIGLIDTREDFDKNESKASYAVIANMTIIEQQVDKFKDYYFAIAIGDNIERADIYKKLQHLGLSTPNFISTHSFVDRTVKMGDGNIIAHRVILNSMAELGCNNLINTAAIVEHNAIVSDHNHLGPMSIMCGNSSTADYCFLGSGASILPNIRLSAYCTLAAGAVLTSSVKSDDKVLIGVPAKVK